MCTIAVGTLIAERPPHRTGRAQLRHPAPTLDVGGEAYALPHAFQAVGGALPARCPGRAVLFRVLLGPRPWLHELLGRSPGLVRSLHSDSWRSLTPRPRASSASARRLPDADRSPPGLTRGSRSPGFRSRSLRTCQGLRPRRTGNALALTRAPVSPSAHDNGVGVPIDSFAAQWLAYTRPCRRFAPGLTTDDARLGASAVRYAFTVVDLHRLLLAGLPAHCHPFPVVTSGGTWRIFLWSRTSR